jgi:hypothetical protein
MNKSIKKYMADLGRKGGSKKSTRKTEASRASLERARAIRWQEKLSEQQKGGSL